MDDVVDTPRHRGRPPGGAWVDDVLRRRRLHLQLPPSRLRPHFVKASVRVHEYPDGTLAVFLGPHRLADYDANGTAIETRRRAA